MGGSSKKEDSKQQQSSNFDNRTEYSYTAPRDSADIEAFREFRPQVDPSIPFRFGAARNRIMSAYRNPTGAYATPELNTQRQTSELEELNQQEGQATREAQFDVNAQRGNQLAALAQLTAPELVATRQYGSGGSQGTSQSVSKTSSPFLGNLFGTIGAGLGKVATGFI